MNQCDYLIQILRDHINSKNTVPFQTDWKALLALSKNHEVTAVVYSQCKDFIPKDILPEYERAYSVVLYYYLNRTRILEQIEEHLSDIGHFIIKGAAVAAFYPVPAFRTMGDTDIVVRTEDREEVHRRFLELGFDSKSKFDDREWQYYKNKMEFELHDHLVYKESVNEDKQEAYFNDFWKHLNGSELDWNFHFMFLIFHLRKHFMNSGVGYRHFMDIAVLTSRGPELNWEWIREELCKMDLWAFTERVFALNEYWFGIPSPLPITGMSEQFLSEATILIEKNGIFGFNNEDNKSNAAVNATRSKGNTRRSMVQTAISKLFPSYKVLSAVPQYSYIKGRKLLLPFAWIHRAVRSIFNRRVGKNMRTVMKESFADNETLQRRNDVYKQWGL